MDIVIISEFCEDFSKTDNDRFLYLANLLGADNKVEIITSSFRHTTKSQRNEPVAKWPFEITFIHEPGYKKNVCLKRFISHYLWGRNVIKYLKTCKRKPDVIYCAVPSLSGPNSVAKFCEKKNIRFIIDVQDLWPEAFQMVFSIPVISSIVFSPFKFTANGIYKRADVICAVSGSYCERAKLVNNKCNDSTTVYLGTELDSFDRYASAGFLLEKNEEEFWIGYAGTLGTSYDLPIVFEALRQVNNNNIRFIVMGDGPKMNEFKELANDLNVTFTGRLEYSKLCRCLKECDLVVNPIVGTSVASIINKHADYAASGKPVLNTQKSDEYRKLITDYQMGFNCDSSEELADRIRYLFENKDESVLLGKNARRCAEECFDRKHTYLRLKNKVLNIP